MSLGALGLNGAPLEPCLATYAAVGAASMLGGVRRRLLSVSVIVIETTYSMTAKSPIVFATFFAKVLVKRSCGLWRCH